MYLTSELYTSVGLTRKKTKKTKKHTHTQLKRGENGSGRFDDTWNRLGVGSADSKMTVRF